jgi:hypothetical protein
MSVEVGSVVVRVRDDGIGISAPKGGADITLRSHATYLTVLGSASGLVSEQ